MIGTAIGLAAQFAPTVYQAILGLNQSNQADKISPDARPVYKTPEAEKAALNLQRMLASSNAPGYTQAKEDIEATGANTLLQSMKGVNPNVAQLYKNQTKNLLDLNMDNEMFRERQMNNLVDSYQRIGTYQDKEFNFNKAQPYAYALNQSMQLKDASNNNIYGALGQGAEGLINSLSLLNENTGVGNKQAEQTTLSPAGEKVDGVPYASPLFQPEKIADNYAGLTDAQKQKSATIGGVITPQSNAQMDEMLKLLIENPEAFKKLYQNSMQF